jgi:hypothetical protein
LPPCRCLARAGSPCDAPPRPASLGFEALLHAKVRSREAAMSRPQGRSPRRVPPPPGLRSSSAAPVPQSWSAHEVPRPARGCPLASRRLLQRVSDQVPRLARLRGASLPEVSSLPVADCSVNQLGSVRVQ